MPLIAVRTITKQLLSTSYVCVACKLSIWTTSLCIMSLHCRAHREAEARHYSTGDHSSASGAMWHSSADHDHNNDDADELQHDEVDEPEENSEEFIATALGAVSTSYLQYCLHNFSSYQHALSHTGTLLLIVC
jgi:hypothetical protein